MLAAPASGFGAIGPTGVTPSAEVSLDLGAKPGPHIVLIPRNSQMHEEGCPS